MAKTGTKLKRATKDAGDTPLLTPSGWEASAAPAVTSSGNHADEPLDGEPPVLPSSTPLQGKRINTPNPSKAERLSGVPNDFMSKAEKREAAADLDPDLEDGDLVLDSKGRMYVHKTKTPKSNPPKPPLAAVPPTASRPRVQSDKGSSKQSKQSVPLALDEDDEDFEAYLDTETTPPADVSTAPAGNSPSLDPEPPAEDMDRESNVGEESSPLRHDSEAEMVDEDNDGHDLSDDAFDNPWYGNGQPFGSTTHEEANAVADFLTGRLHMKTPAISPKNSRHAEVSTSFWLHGTNAVVGEHTAVSDELDTIEWNIGKDIKTKVYLPRLADLDDLPKWNAKMDVTVNLLLTTLSNLGSRNPYKGLTHEEARIALLEVFDLRVLLKRMAKKQLSTLYFAGCDIQQIPSRDIYLTMMKYFETSTVKMTTEGILRELNALRMKVVTYYDAAKGQTVSKAFSTLWLEFTGILELHNSNAFNGSIVLSHTLVTLIEPEELRQTMIKVLLAAIQRSDTVTLYGKPPQRVDLLNVWSVYTLIHQSIVDTIDPGMLTNGAFLENLMVTNFFHPHVPTDFLAMNRSPHKQSFRGRDRYRESKRYGSGADRNNREYKKARTDRAPSNSGARTESSAAPGSVDNRSSSTGTPGRSGTGGASSSGASSSTRTNQPSRDSGARNNNNKGKPTATSTSGKKPDRDPSAAAAKCCMCNETGHKSSKCTRYDTCTCGASLRGGDKRHDPFRCPNGPLTMAGKAALAKMVKKK